jgi:hypothetical protein
MSTLFQSLSLLIGIHLNGHNQSRAKKEFTDVAAGVKMMEDSNKQLITRFEQFTQEQQKRDREQAEILAKRDREQAEILEKRDREQAEILEKRDREHAGEIAAIANEVKSLTENMDKLGLRQLANVIEERITRELGDSWEGVDFDQVDRAYRRFKGLERKSIYEMIEEEAECYERIIMKAFQIPSSDVASHSKNLSRNIKWARRQAFSVAHDQSITKDEMITMIKKTVKLIQDQEIFISMVTAAENLKPPGSLLLEFS